MHTRSRDRTYAADDAASAQPTPPPPAVEEWARAMTYKAADGRVALVGYIESDAFAKPEYREELERLRQFAEPESGVMRGRAWNTAGRRETVQVSADGRQYRYSGSAARKRAPVTWAQTPLLDRMRQLVGEMTQSEYNFALINYYSAKGALGWHSDDEADLVPGAKIASVSLSSEPKWFDVRVKTDHTQRWRFELRNGSLVVMGADCQALMQHCVPPQAKLKPDFWRINVTFRQLKE